MARSRTKTATAAADAPADETGGDVFDQAIADRQQEETARQAQAVVQQVADSTRIDSEHAPGHIANPSSTRREGHADAVGKKEYKKAPDPRGSHTIMLSPDPKGPKARLLRSQEHNDMWIQFSENPGKEITDQIREAGFHWERRAESDFAKGAWLLPLEPGNEWRNHAHAEEVFRNVVNQVRERNGMEAFVSGAAQSAS